MNLQALITSLEDAGYPLTVETAELIINPNDFCFYDKLYAINNEFGLIAFVIADCLQDALDEAADNGVMDQFAWDLDEPKNDSTDYLGNESKPFNLEYCFTKQL